VKPTDEWRASRLHQLGVMLICAKVALIPVIFDYSLDVPFTVAKTLLSHSLGYALSGVMAGLLLRFGRSFVVWSPLHIPVLAFLAANIAATAFAADQPLALYGTHVRMLGLGTIADWVVLYFAVVFLVRTRTAATAVTACALCASIVVLAYELVQLLGRDPFSWNMDVVARPISTVGQATSLAQYLTVLAIGAAGIALVVQDSPRIVRVMLLALSAVLMVGAAATGTRSAILGIGAGAAIVVLATWLRSSSARARVLGLVAVVVASAALAILFLVSPVGARFAAVVSPQLGDNNDDLLARLEPATETRGALYQIAAALVRDRPILGYGPDNFVVGVAKFRTASEPPEIRQSLATSAHSWVGYAATSGGLIGLAAFVGIAALALGLAFRADVHSFALVGAAMLLSFLGTGLTTINEISTDWLFWGAAATIAGVTARPRKASMERPKSKPKRSPRVPRPKRPGSSWDARRVLAILCATIGLALCFTAFNAWEASRSNRASQQARLQGRVAEGIDRGLHATRLDPGRPQYWHTLGLAYISASRWADASVALDRATKLAPYDVRNAGDLARVHLLMASAGDRNAEKRAVELANDVVRVDPNNPLANLTRAVVMQFTGNLPEAAQSVSRAVALDPDSANANLHVSATQIYVDSGRATDAVLVARRGLRVLGGTPASVPLRYELARALVANRQPSEALAELDSALAIQPGYAPAQRLRSEILGSL
jgi:O-antigen ligase/tetratricopeptide (TPR) repeat protein